jgi:integrase/recombinase XerD
LRNADYRLCHVTPLLTIFNALLIAAIVNPPSYGAHLLRHSAATALLCDGMTLETVSAVLRHRSLDMTAYYAKVDIPNLIKIAQP